MKKILNGAICAYAFYLGLYSNVSYAENLKDVLAIAYSNNPTLAASRASLRATDENINQANAGWRPTINLSGDISTSELTNNNLFFKKKSSLYPKNLGVSLRYNLFNGFQTVNNSKAAKSQSKAGQGRLVNIEQQILLDTVAAYVDIKRDEKILVIVSNNVAVLRRFLQANIARFEAGEITKTDVSYSKARYARSLTQRIRAESALKNSRTAFRRVVGNSPATLDNIIGIPNLPGTEVEALAIAQSENPLLMAAKYLEAAAGHSVSAAKGGLLPKLDISAQYKRGWDGARQGELTTYKSVAATVTVPLYQAGINSSRIRQAKEFENQRRLEMVATGRQVDQMVRNSWEGYRETTARMRSAGDQAEANKTALKGIIKEAKAGSKSVLQVLDAEQEFLDARATLIRAQRDKIFEAYRLLSAVGGLTAQKLQLDVQYYDANAQRNDGQLYGWGVKD